MNILLTNDDGVDSPGILTLAKYLRARGDHDIFILAPDSNRSGVSHGLGVFRFPVEISEKAERVFCCTGLPADCVLVAALGGRPCRPDLVISGINQGPNLGTAIIYSGTCAAARQAALHGIPGIALSINGWDNYNWDMAASYTADHLEEFLSFWEKEIFINVNFPNSALPSGMVHTRPAKIKYKDTLTFKTAAGGKECCTLVSGGESVEDDPGSDWAAVSRNMVSVSSVCVFPDVRRDSGKDASPGAGTPGADAAPAERRP